LVKKSGALDQLQPLPLAWRKKEEKCAFRNPIHGLFAVTYVANDVENIVA